MFGIIFFCEVTNTFDDVIAVIKLDLRPFNACINLGDIIRYIIMYMHVLFM